MCAQLALRLVEFGGGEDQGHLLIEAHPSMNLARFVGSLKTVSSRYLRKEFEVYLRKFFWKKRFWNNAYVVSAGGHASIERLLHYIQDQEAPPC